MTQICDNCDPALAGTACDDGDVCTTGETYDANCDCVGGNFVDQDGDGVCAANDPDDTDVCVPNASNCGSGCTSFDLNGFESTLGIWNDGGGDARAGSYPAYASTGNNAVRIRDNSGVASSIFTDPLNFSGVPSLEVSFSFYPRLMENGEDFFLEVSTNGGSSFAIIEDYITGTDFVNNQQYDIVETIPGSNLSANTVLRFRCDATANQDEIYLDDIEISTCATDDIVELPQEKLNTRASENISISNNFDDDDSDSEVILYPNPASTILNLKLDSDISLIESVEFFDLKGAKIKALTNVNENLLELDLNDIEVPGIYLIKILTTSNQYYLEKFIKN